MRFFWQKEEEEGVFVSPKELHHDCKVPTLDQILKSNADFGSIWLCKKCGDTWELEREYSVLNLDLNLRELCRNSIIKEYKWIRKSVQQLEYEGKLGVR